MRFSALPLWRSHKSRVKGHLRLKMTYLPNGLEEDSTEQGEDLDVRAVGISLSSRPTFLWVTCVNNGSPCLKGAHDPRPKGGRWKKKPQNDLFCQSSLKGIELRCLAAVSGSY